MKIQSKRTGRLEDVTREDWEFMRKRQMHRNFAVVDDSDEHFESIEIKVEPINLMDENDDLAEGVTPEVEEPDDEEEQKGFYRKFLDEKEISYDKRLGLKKLKQLYEENI